jgi:hypothetical protein
MTPINTDDYTNCPNQIRVIGVAILKISVTIA